MHIKFVCLFFWQFFFVVVIVLGVLLFCFYILAGMWNSSLMRDQTLASAVKAPNPNYSGLRELPLLSVNLQVPVTKLRIEEKVSFLPA